MADQWFYNRNGQKSGPVTLGDLRRLAANGGLSPEDQIWKEGMISWSPASSVKALFGATSANIPPASVAASTAAIPARPAPPAPRATVAVGGPREPAMRSAPVPPNAGPVPSLQPTVGTAPAGDAATATAGGGKGLHPAAVGLALFLFFPLGFILLAMHPTLRSKTAWWVAGVAWALLIMLSPKAAREEKITDDVAQEERSSSPAETPEPSSAGSGSRVTPTKPKGTHSVGDTFTLGDFKYTINGVSARKAIGTTAFGRFMGETASPGATFVIVSYTMENVGSESQTVLSDDFQIQDGANRTFKGSTKANVALLTESEDKDFLLSELQPGLPRTMQQAFELPEKVLEAPITIVIPEKGLFSSGKAKVQVSVR
jgi:hypothetical protein